VVATLVVACVAVYDRVGGRGLVNAFGGGVGGDFLAFYTAGSFVARGTPEGLSDPNAQLAFQEHVIGSSLEGVALWVSPPYFAWFFAPLAGLPYVGALLVWALGSLFAVWLSFRVLRRELGITSTPGQMIWIGVQYFPTLHWLLNGQITGLWLTLFTFVFVLLRRRRDGWAGLLLGCLACKPPLALGVLVALCAARRYRAVLASLASIAAFVALGFATFPQSMHAYLAQREELVALVRGQGYNTSGLHGSFEFATLLFDGISPPFASAVGIVIALGLLTLIVSLWWRTPWLPATAPWDVRMAATLALGLIASPHLFLYDLAILLLPLFILRAHYPERDGLPLGGHPLLPLVAVIWALGLLGPALAVFQQAASTWLFGVSMALQPGVLAIAAGALFVVQRTRLPSQR
jgi:arabinofuranan 3-O-arabinosyltransferase